MFVSMLDVSLSLQPCPNAKGVAILDIDRIMPAVPPEPVRRIRTLLRSSEVVSVNFPIFISVSMGVSLRQRVLSFPPVSSITNSVSLKLIIWVLRPIRS